MTFIQKIQLVNDYVKDYSCGFISKFELIEKIHQLKWKAKSEQLFINQFYSDMMTIDIRMAEQDLLTMLK